MNTTVGVWTPGVFVNSNNTVYLADQTHQVIHVWPEGSSGPTRNISAPDIFRFSIFVNTEERYLHVWLEPVTESDLQMDEKLDDQCNSDEFCSQLLRTLHRYEQHSLLFDLCQSSSLERITHEWFSCSIRHCWNWFYWIRHPRDLNSPRGIFVNTNFSLYVADSGNNRIQYFISGQSSGTTVAGNGASGTITLSSPFAVVLDGDGYLFIADTNNNRIVGSGPYGFRCVAGCSRMNGSAPDQLGTPYMLSFDGYGNIYVTDTGE